VIDNVLLPLEIVGERTPDSRDGAMRLLHLLGIESFANRFPRELSGGMQQRVSIARTLLPKPRILLMDEPFGALDAITRGRLNLDLLETCAREGSTCVFVTHDIDEAILLSDRVALMSPRPGRLRQIFTVDLPRPRTLEMRYTPRFGDLAREIHGQMAAQTMPAAA